MGGGPGADKVALGLGRGRGCGDKVGVARVHDGHAGEHQGCSGARVARADWWGLRVCMICMQVSAGVAPSPGLLQLTRGRVCMMCMQVSIRAASPPGLFQLTGGSIYMMRMQVSIRAALPPGLL